MMDTEDDDDVGGGSENNVECVLSTSYRILLDGREKGSRGSP